MIASGVMNRTVVVVALCGLLAVCVMAETLNETLHVAPGPDVRVVIVGTISLLAGLLGGYHVGVNGGFK